MQRRPNGPQCWDTYHPFGAAIQFYHIRVLMHSTLFHFWMILSDSGIANLKCIVKANAIK